MQLLYDNWAFLVAGLMILVFCGSLVSKAEGWGKDDKHHKQ
jgi:hypothetical protein